MHVLSMNACVFDLLCLVDCVWVCVCFNFYRIAVFFFFLCKMVLRTWAKCTVVLLLYIIMETIFTISVWRCYILFHLWVV